MVVINHCRFIEDAGHEAIPIGHQGDWRAIDIDGNLYRGYSRPGHLVRADRHRQSRWPARGSGRRTAGCGFAERRAEVQRRLDKGGPVCIGWREAASRQSVLSFQQMPGA